MKEKIAFIILFWNSEKHIEACLRSVFSLSYDVFVVAVNNGSTDKTSEILDRFKDNGKMDVISLPENMGTTKSRNMALKKIPEDTKWICILDDDTIINELAVDALIAAMKENEEALIASPRMWDKSKKEQMSCKRFPTLWLKIKKVVPIKKIKQKAEKDEAYSFFPGKSFDDSDPPIAGDKNIYEADYAISACWMMKKEILSEVGFLNEKIFYSPEDTEYCVQIWKAGYKVIFVSGASIYHMTQRRSHKKFFSRVNIEHIKGLVYFFWKYRAFLKTRRKALRP